MSLSLTQNFSWTFVGNMIYAGFYAGILIMLAKFGSPEMVGQFALALAVVTPAVNFGNLHLRAILGTDVLGVNHFGDYLALRLLTILIGLLAIAWITWAVGYRWETGLIIMVMGLAKGFESVSDIVFGLLQQHERMDRIGLSLAIKGPLSLAMLWMGVYLTGHLLWGVVGLALSWLLVLVGYDLRSGYLVLKRGSIGEENFSGEEARLSRSLRPRWHTKTLKKLTQLAFPLGLVSLLVALGQNIPRYWVERYLGEWHLGIFSAVAALMGIGMIVVAALGSSASPRLAKFYAAGNYTDFRVLLMKLVGLGALLGVAGIILTLLLGREILTLLFKPEYGDFVHVMVWIMAAACVTYIGSFLGQALIAMRSFSVQVPLYVFVVGVTAVACFILVPREGITGAAISFLIGALAQAGGSLFLMRRVLWRPRLESEKVASCMS